MVKNVKAGKTVYFCQNCGYESSKWAGQCPACKEWNTFAEEVVKPQSKVQKKLAQSVEVKTLDQVDMESAPRIETGIEELDRVLGGGIVQGSLILVGGDPGIGKSTLLLQVCQKLCGAENAHSILYISGEESLRQIKMRADRLGKFTDALSLMCETNLDTIFGVIEKNKPEIVMIDSIQTMFNENIASAPGSVSQVRETTNVLLQMAKGMGISVFIVGHVTKEGSVAGPKVLEHMVDTVLYFEGERNASYRILRSVKNRFGSTNEIGVFEMQENGLAEVRNPSEYMLQGRPEGVGGSVVACSLEGTRPILVEIQALVSRTSFGFPKRTAAGCDYNRVNLLMAVLEKRVGMNLSDCDAYVNLAGGMKVNEPAMDLGIILAIVSCFKNRPVDPDVMIFGEVGLSGEVRSVSMPQSRVNEAARLGFHTCILPKVSVSGIKAPKGIKLLGVRSVKEAIDLI